MIREGFLYRFTCDKKDKLGNKTDTLGKPLCKTPPFIVIITKHSSADREKARKIACDKGWVGQGKRDFFCPDCAKEMKLIPGAELQSDILLVDKKKVNA